MWTAWLDLWRSRPVLVRSPLPPQVAIDRLAAARSQGFVWPPDRSVGVLRTVVGHVAQDGVRLSARAIRSRNLWRPVLRGNVRAVPGGSELVGSFAMHPFTRAIMALWLAGVAAFALTWVGATVVAGGRSLVWRALAGTGAMFAFASLGVALFSAGAGRGMSDEEALRHWVARQLHAERKPDPTVTRQGSFPDTPQR